ncbi:MAG: RNA 2',3'-cyclic phosphodiesterase [Blautia sp.]|nr:RNA 2',3'-cyclic phosphodiesterase [Blautia sp.]
MRVFLAVQPSDDLRNALIKVMHETKKLGLGGNYVPAQNLHMTLAFIGEVNDIEGIKAAMQAVPLEQYRISLDGHGFFGDLLYVGVKGNQKIKKYASDLKKELDKNGVSYDRSKFEPHITIIRKVTGRRPASLAIPKQEMTVKKVSLMKSEQKNGKTVYKEIFSVN